MTDSDDGTMNDLLQEKDMKISSLERAKIRQDEDISELRKELGTVQIRHKEELYWIRMELDNAKRDKENIESRMKILERKLKEDSTTEESSSAGSDDPEYVTGLQSKVSKYSRQVTILEEQSSMMEQQHSDNTKSLKEELGNIMDSKVHMEMDLLNQLATLDAKNQELEIEFKEQLEYKDSKLRDLKFNSSGTDISLLSVEKKNQQDMNSEISELKLSKKKLEDELEVERNECDDAISRLEDTNADLEHQIELMTSDLKICRVGAASEAVQVLDALTRDRQETLTTLERVAIIWEKADESIQGLEDVMDELRPNDEDDVEGDSIRLLSTLETASLVHGQIKVALLLIELKLRNQLSSLKNDKLRVGIGPTPDYNLEQQISNIQDETLSALDSVEDSLADQIQQLESLTREETAKVRRSLLEKTEDMQIMQTHQEALENEITQLRSTTTSGDDYLDGTNGSGSSSSGISRVTLERLQNEILTVVDRVKSKNETILKLKASMEDLETRASTYKKELKRLKRSNRSRS
eukprot:CAMPEP_0194141102 /NCGR_PEP_ID=MMETSP0152-20130528/10587_1 /TAXON_ID=1049557 /ORGANISM="Thalassiothrix antarctica, Strain L6-D1" /LENGTH=524 /DNA_ID=CAMNT_0038839633 /DNA_START=8 /DNA_END=1582 /DNA_ORIENTATION=+